MQNVQAIQFQESDLRCHRWGLILAGGDGQRLLPLTRRITGDDRPKQFCTVLGNETLLQQTRHRVSLLVPRWRTLLVLTKTHETFYSDEVAGLSSSSVLVQPCNRGTTPAILYSLMRLREMDAKAIVAFFPSDHYYSNEDAFVREIDLCYASAAFRRDAVILLGIAPETPEGEYGWIEPGIPLGNPVPNSVTRVSRFWEKPGTLAPVLMERGCLWNSFVMVGHVNAFLNLVKHTLPSLVESFESIRPSFLTRSETTEVRDLYSVIRTSDFSRDVLSVEPDELAVLRGIGLGWSDMGEPSRVLSVLERKGATTEWGDKPAYVEEWRTAAGVELR
jgi:mannose-1-phosphate guanylyltransferase